MIFAGRDRGAKGSGNLWSENRKGASLAQGRKRAVKRREGIP